MGNDASQVHSFNASGRVCRFSGADWVRSALRIEPSELGADVADLLGEWVLGIYHLERVVQKVDWADQYRIAITFAGGLATFDFDNLTRLVFLAHDYCIRCEVTATGPRYLKLAFHRRQRTGGISQRHPTIEQALESYRGSFPAPSSASSVVNPSPSH